MEQKNNCLAIMTIVMFGGKRGRLASQRTQWQHHVVGVLCCIKSQTMVCNSTQGQEVAVIECIAHASAAINMLIEFR
jgi:hypothetical protein